MNRTIAGGIAFSASLALILLAAAFVLTTSTVRSAPGDAVADRVLGQPNFTSGACGLATPTPTATTPATPVGTPTPTPTAQSVTPSPTLIGASGAGALCIPRGAAVDNAGNLYVADTNSNRVLEYDVPLTTDALADRVFGQGGNFNSLNCNFGGISASSLCGPGGVAVDASGNLFVADSVNSRILEYDHPLTTDTIADRVFGQGGSFTSGTCNLGGISANSLCGSRGVGVDPAGNVYIPDANRVLEYDSPLTTDTVADRVFGQGGSFTSNSGNLGGISANSLCGTYGVTVDGAGNLYVAEQCNNRVLEFDTPVNTDSTGDRVFGQGGSFTSNTCNLGGISASSLCQPTGVAVDGAGNLYVADQNNSRVLEYDGALNTDTVADRVFGRPDFTTGAGQPCAPPSASSQCFAEGLAVDVAGNLYVADDFNSRVLEYDAPVAMPTPCPACTPTPSPTASPTATPTATASPTATPCPTEGCPTPTATRTASPTMTASPTLTATATASPSPASTLFCPGTPTRTPSATPTPTGGSAFGRVVPLNGTCVLLTLSPTPTSVATPTPTQTATATPGPTPGPGLHDGRAKKISAAGSVVLSGGSADTKNLVVQVRNEGDHTETIGVYVDIVPPGGITNPFGCTPFGRVINTVVTLGTSNQTNQTSVTATLSFNCADVDGALGQTYTIMAGADAHADDAGACGPFQIQSMTCFSALADDDNDPSDNRATTSGFQVK